MRLLRAIVLTVSASLSLLAGTATIADAAPHPNNPVAITCGDGADLTDPGDPGLPPDP